LPREARKTWIREPPARCMNKPVCRGGCGKLSGKVGFWVGVFLRSAPPVYACTNHVRARRQLFAFLRVYDRSR
jgi:hypothetical protein